MAGSCICLCSFGRLNARNLDGLSASKTQVYLADYIAMQWFQLLKTPR